MKRKIFFRFFVVILASTLLMFIFGFVAVKRNTEKIMTERLIEETKIVGLLLSDREKFDRFKIYEGDSKFRVTIIGLDGEVLHESDTSDPLENHLDREEIQSALLDKPEAITRYSETFECDMTYYAMKVRLDSGEVVILRLAIWGSENSAYLRLTIPLLVVVLICDLVLAFLISHFISSSISSKVVGIGNSLRSLNKGEYVPIVADSNEAELYSVLCQINELNESTHKHMREMEREHKKLARVLDNISQGIIALDNSREIAFINKSIRDIFGCNDSVVGKGVSSLIDNLPMLSKVSNHIFDNYSFECSYKERELSVVIHELQKDELTISTIIIITDITSEKQIAKQKSDFFANASHELKTPVTVMQGLSELLLDNENLDTGSQKRVERIHKESVRLGSLISDMLKLSKLEGGEEIELTSVKIDLYEVFSEVLDELKVKIAGKNITCSVCGNASVLADPKKMYELALNLTSNAVSYNKNGGSITVLLEENEKESTIRVSDTGIGIEKKHIPMLCQRFYRVDKSRSKKTGGTGLGLAIVKHICALYSATLEIESELGVGSSFIVKFKK